MPGLVGPASVTGRHYVWETQSGRKSGGTLFDLFRAQCPKPHEHCAATSIHAVYGSDGAVAVVPIFQFSHAKYAYL